MKASSAAHVNVRRFAKTRHRHVGLLAAPQGSDLFTGTHWFAALQLEGSVLPQLVVKIVEGESEGGWRPFEHHVKV